MVLLVFDPRQTWARLYDYDRDDRRVGIALCAEHGDAVSVPAGWTIVDDRSSTPHLASVPAEGAVADGEPDLEEFDDAEPEPERAPQPEAASGGTATRGTAGGTASDRASSPTLWSVEEPSAGGDRVDDVRPGDDLDEPEPADGRDRGDDLDVDESTPLLSRAFRAAHVD